MRRIDEDPTDGPSDVRPTVTLLNFEDILLLFMYKHIGLSDDAALKGRRSPSKGLKLNLLAMAKLPFNIAGTMGRNPGQIMPNVLRV